MNFRLSLLLLGLLCVGYLGLRWWWLEAKYRASLRSKKSPESVDVPIESIEPTMHGASQPLSDKPLGDASPQALGVQGLAQGSAAAAPVDGAPADGKSAGEGGLASEAVPMSLPLPAPSAQHRPVLNALIDSIAMLHMEAPTLGDAVLAWMPATRRIGAKTWLVEGLQVKTRVWEPVVAGRMYEHYQAGIQLVNRHGALNEVEFSEFVVKVSQLAESLGAAAEFAEMLAEVARARALEPFAAAHDIILMLHVQAKRTPWSLAYLQQQIKQLGFVAGMIPGRWVLGADGQEFIALNIDPQAAMAEEATPVPIYKFSLRLEVARVPRLNAQGQRPFEALAEVVRLLCARLDAVLLDEQGLQVEAAALARTTQELEAVYDRLDGVGLSAGSALAKRLFS